MRDPHEIELKLTFDPADRTKLGATNLLPAGEAVRLVSTYFDTAELAVRKAGYSLRIRETGNKRIQTVKADTNTTAGLFVRGEWEQVIDGEEPLLDAHSGPLREIVGHAPLEQVFVTDVRRTIHILTIANARIECAIDDGDIHAGEQHATVSEIELELRDGSVSSLFDIARQLNEVIPLRLAVTSKAERGYRLSEGNTGTVAKAEPLNLRQDTRPHEAFQLIAGNCLRQFRLNETNLLEDGKPEFLHQARVGLRRLRTAFSLFKPVLVPDGRVTLLHQGLQKLAVQLGELRNIDVLMACSRPPLRSRLASIRQQAFEHVRTELDSRRTRSLMIDLAEWLALGEWRSQPHDAATQEVTPFACQVLTKKYRQLKHRGKGLAALDDESRHRVRITAKKLYYASQFFASLYDSGKALRRHRSFLTVLKKLQDHLGDLNDLTMRAHWVERLGITGNELKTKKTGRKKLLKLAAGAYDELCETKLFWSRCESSSS